MAEADVFETVSTTVDEAFALVRRAMSEVKQIEAATKSGPSSATTHISDELHQAGQELAGLVGFFKRHRCDLHDDEAA